MIQKAEKQEISLSINNWIEKQEIFILIQEEQLNQEIKNLHSDNSGNLVET